MSQAEVLTEIRKVVELETQSVGPSSHGLTAFDLLLPIQVGRRKN